MPLILVIANAALIILGIGALLGVAATAYRNRAGAASGKRILYFTALVSALALGTVQSACGRAPEGRDGDVISVFDGFIPRREQAAIRAGNSTYDATDDIHKALAAVDGTGKTLLFPSGTYYVGEVAFAGARYTVETEDVTFQQRPGLTGDNGIHPIIAFPQDASDIRLGDISLKGNIATDHGEFSHGIAVLSAKNITIGDVDGENIRGDVLYTYGRTTSEAEYQRNLVTGVIRGKNIFRCIVAMAGGQATIAGIIQDGPVGYRDFDAEPNGDGAYQPVQAVIGYIQGSVVQITSADPNIVNAGISVGHLDLDGDRIENSLPNHPSHGGRNAIALAVNHVDAVRIETLKLRNYDSYPVQLASKWHSIKIGTLDFMAAGTKETTYKAVVVQQGLAGDGVISIDRIVGALAGPDRFVLRSDVGLLKVNLGTVDVEGGGLGAYLTGYIGEMLGTISRRGDNVCMTGCRDIQYGRGDLSRRPTR